MGSTDDDLEDDAGVSGARLVRPSEGRGAGVLLILGVALTASLVELFPAADVVEDVRDEDGDEYEERDQSHGVTVVVTR